MERLKIMKKNHIIITTVLLALFLAPGLFYNKIQNYTYINNYSHNYVQVKDKINTNMNFPEKQSISGNDNDSIYPMLSSQENSIIAANNQTANSLADDIINEIDSGDFFKYHSIPSLENTYFGLKILQDLNQLKSVNITLITNYIMSCFNETTGYFSDRYTGLLNYLELYQQEGYSKVAATDYAVLSLNILSELNILDVSQKEIIVNNIKSAINPNDGGFCDPQGFPMNTSNLNSSVMLSYYSYLTLMLLDPTSLTQDQLNTLVSFISSCQSTSSNNYICGGFLDKISYDYSNIETTYYAVKLMATMGKLGDINLTNLSSFINSLTDINIAGVYSSLAPAGTDYPTPEYYSTSLVLAIENITGIIVNMNTQDALQYILSGLNTTSGYWPLFRGSDKFLLRDNFLLIESYLEIGNTFSSITNSEIANGIQDFLSPLRVNSSYEGNEVYASGFGPLSDKLSSLSEMTQNIQYLTNTGKIEELNATEKTNIYNEIQRDVYFSKNNQTYWFTEFPGYIPTNSDLYCIYGQPLEYAQIPRNLSDFSQYGWGISQTFNALTILNDLGILYQFNSKYDLNTFATGVLTSQIPYGSILTGGFAPDSDCIPLLKTVSPYKNIFQSIETTYFAICTLQTIDQFLGSSYLDQVNVTSLSSYLQSIKHETSTKLYYSDSISNKCSYNAEMTFYIMEINRILDLNLLNSTNNDKIWNWIQENPDFPGTHSNYSYSGAVWSVMACKNLDYRNNITLNLTTLRNIYSSWFSSNPNFLTMKMVNFRQIEILNLLFSDAFSNIVFSRIPSLNIMFSPIIHIRLAGVTCINLLPDSLEYRFIENNGTYWDDGSWKTMENGTDNSFIVDPINYLGARFYPNFTFEIRDIGDFYDNRIRNYTIVSTFNYGLDLLQLSTNQICYPNEILNSSFGVYAMDDIGNLRPLNDLNITIFVFNGNKQIETLNENYSTRIQDGMNWITIFLNASQNVGNYTMRIEVSNNLFSTDASKIRINSTSNKTINLSNVVFLNSDYTYAFTLNYSIINKTQNQNQITTPNKNSNSTQNTNEKQNTSPDPVKFSRYAIGGLLITIGVVFTASGTYIVKKRRINSNTKSNMNNNKRTTLKSKKDVVIKGNSENLTTKSELKNDLKIKGKSQFTISTSKLKDNSKYSAKIDLKKPIIPPITYENQEQQQTSTSKVYYDDIKKFNEIREKEDESYNNDQISNSEELDIEDTSNKIDIQNESIKTYAIERGDIENNDIEYGLMSKRFDNCSDYEFKTEEEPDIEKRVKPFKKMLFNRYGFKLT